MIEQIKASAGSGKTHTLTMRFLQLLGASAGETFPPACRRLVTRDAAIRPFSEILAMTFTNKAAAEMKERVIETLKKIALTPADCHADGSDRLFCPQEARQWLNSLLRRYDALNIRTIDSLLTLLLRISAAPLGLRPDMELAFDDAEYLAPLYDELLDRAAGGDGAVQEALQDAARSILTTAHEFEGLTPKGRIRKQVLETLGLLQAFPQTPCLDKQTVFDRMAGAQQSIASAALGLLETLHGARVILHKRFAAFLERTCEFTLRDKLPIESAYASKGTLAECLAGVSKKEPVPEALEHAYQHFTLDMARSCQQIELYSSALSLMPFAALALLLLPELRRLHLESGRLPSSQVPLLARDLLNAEHGVSEACCRMGSRLSHLLIDEFQDTSREQWDAIKPLAIECLSRAGSLHYVGDVKQAIYSWRGGDSSLFDEVSEDPELLDIDPAPCRERLPYNWRSAPAVIQYNNDFFSRLEDADTAYAVAERLLPSAVPAPEIKKAAQGLQSTFRHTGQKLPEHGQNARPGFVRVMKIAVDSAAEAYTTATRDAFKLALQDDILTRRKPGEIAVLVRKGSEAELVSTWLMELGVSVVTEHSFKLAANPVICRLIALLRFLDYPPDDLHFFEFISGEECFGLVSGLTRSEMQNWLAGVRLRSSAQGNRAAPLFTLFRQSFPEQWQTLLEPFYNQAGLMGAYDLISEVVQRYELLERIPEQAVYVRRFLELLYAAENKGYSSTAAFLDYWATKGQEEKIPSPEAPDAVSILTMHKAKGLEFPIVVMPFHRFTESSQTEPCFVNFEGLPLLVRASSALGKRYYAKQRTAALEKMNLLYVGWTRAREELHLILEEKKSTQKKGMTAVLDEMLSNYAFEATEAFPAGEYTSGVRLSSLVPLENHASESVFTPTAPGHLSGSNSNDLHGHSKQMPPGMTDTLLGDTAPSANDPYHIAPGSFDGDWRPMQWLPRLKIFRNPVPELEYDQRVRGLLFHDCLEHLLIPPYFLSEEALRKLLAKTVEYTLRNFTIPVWKQDLARSELLEGLSWFCAQPVCVRWLQTGLREQSIMDAHGALHRIDLLVEDADSMLVVDYKSGLNREEHRDQVRRYMHLLGDLTAACGKRSKHIKGVLVYLGNDDSGKGGRGFEEVML